ncbi:ribosome rescue GTPase HflX [Nitrosococcus oceani]|uniref:GTPase HflX n=2 Tax=Nitrosococcus oceani TaxID=1229 RepID=Q3J804_NITOC|nr:ribosome rescue GTPase HflX [Nitrosococcus oceani]ABA59042.1 GTP-binding protein HflX [Nitrosococcus oceani ATCC 19707]EDZ65346.1 GTP-binding proten HflX [Nitrosococcus oceani AFC27]KFI18565.1 GTP-binding protein HflX [Nitrosococcus oceani C-27]KFI21793.1 GTP-binding protein HflX [Nitrosococcus oceani]
MLFSHSEGGRGYDYSAILVHIDFHEPAYHEMQAEFIELVSSTGIEIVTVLSGKRQSPHSKYFIGRGKVDEIRVWVDAEQADLVVFNHDLSPSQERNLEQSLQCRVLDRTELILDIFSQRARSHEGKLQVELAQLQHLSTRLVRGWSHLERQKGGIGLRGPGETQLETDRRLIGNRIRQLRKRLERVRKQRDQGRRSRHKARVPTVSLVGYTNAGKSTLFNRLTAARVLVDDRLFATLDPTLRRLRLALTQPLILADTVGFIRNLPHDLVEAFRSTLEETRDAALLLHVIDASSEGRCDLIAQVNKVLQTIGAEGVPQLEVYNKIDRVEGCQPRLERDASGRVHRVWLSATSGEGLELLRQALAEYFPAKRSVDPQQEIHAYQ